MRVFVEPVPSTLSRAMYRVAWALRRYAPKTVMIVDHPEEADLQVFHAIGMSGMREAILKTREFAVIQYCWKSANGDQQEWDALWGQARVVMSYYELPVKPDVNFVMAPLGVDGQAFTAQPGDGRHVGVVTSGYVSGAGAEAIEEVADAALKTRLSVLHVGPSEIVGMRRRREKSWMAVHHLDDARLASTVYGKALWVSGLRHIEGFELPVIEGLACGARPIVFDLPEMRRWYEGHAVFVPECSGPKLVEELVRVFSEKPKLAGAEERASILEKFNWERTASAFWAGVVA